MKPALQSQEAAEMIEASGGTVAAAMPRRSNASVCVSKPRPGVTRWAFADGSFVEQERGFDWHPFDASGLQTHY